jgi:hypothetical protein
MGTRGSSPRTAGESAIVRRNTATRDTLRCAMGDIIVLEHC